MAEGDRMDAERRIVVQPPEPDMTPATLIERARALRPMLRAQQEEADKRGYYTDEVHEAIKAAGLYRAVQPRMFGGYQFDMETLFKIVVEISRGHPSSGWCYTLATSHALLVGSHYSEEAQAEIFGPDGDFRSPHRAPPAGKWEKADGGWRVSGTWAYSSGSPVSTHFIGGAVIPNDDGSPRGINFIVRRDQVTILEDSWGGDTALGMQGSGSHAVVVDNVFVPDRHIITSSVLLSSEYAPEGTVGLRLHGDVTFLGVVGGIYQATFGAILTGTARAAIDEYEEIIKTSKSYHVPGLPRTEEAETQRVLGKAMQLTDAAEALTLRCATIYREQCENWAATGKPITTQDTLRLWGVAQEACFMACEATTLLFHTAGVRAAGRGQKLQRYFRDIQMYLVHPSSQSVISSSIAQLELGVPMQAFGGRGK